MKNIYKVKDRLTSTNLKVSWFYASHIKDFAKKYKGYEFEVKVDDENIGVWTIDDIDMDEKHKLFIRIERDIDGCNCCDNTESKTLDIDKAWFRKIKKN